MHSIIDLRTIVRSNFQKPYIFVYFRWNLLNYIVYIAFYIYAAIESNIQKYFLLKTRCITKFYIYIYLLFTFCNTVGILFSKQPKMHAFKFQNIHIYYCIKAFKQTHAFTFNIYFKQYSPLFFTSIECSALVFTFELSDDSHKVKIIVNATTTKKNDVNWKQTEDDNCWK